jgi:hypothetical protein
MCLNMADFDQFAPPRGKLFCECKGPTDLGIQLRCCRVGLFAPLPQVPCNNGRTSGPTVSKLVHISTPGSSFTRELSE